MVLVFICYGYYFQVTEQMMVDWGGEKTSLEKQKFIWSLVPKLGQGIKQYRTQ